MQIAERCAESVCHSVICPRCDCGAQGRSPGSSFCVALSLDIAKRVPAMSDEMWGPMVLQDDRDRSPDSSYESSSSGGHRSKAKSKKKDKGTKKNKGKKVKKDTKGSSRRERSSTSDNWSSKYTTWKATPALFPATISSVLCTCCCVLEATVSLHG